MSDTKKPIIKLLEGSNDGRKVLTIYVGRFKKFNAGSTRDFDEALVLIRRWLQKAVLELEGTTISRD